MSSTNDVRGKDAEGRKILGEKDLSNKIQRLAAQINERYPADLPCFVGIHTRGVTVAERVRAALGKSGNNVPLGTLDISFYRDDLDHRRANPVVQASEIPFEVEGAQIIIFDDVLYTGRTIRAAIDGLLNYGRPSKIELAVIVDRRNRELPIQPDYVGETINTQRLDRIRVCFSEHDGEDSISLISAP